MVVGEFHTIINSALSLLFVGLMYFGKVYNRFKWTMIFGSIKTVILLIVAYIFSMAYPAFVLYRVITYLLILGSIWEILQTDFDKNTYWVYGVWLLIVIPALFFPPYGYWYYVPRLPLFAIGAYYLPLSLRKKHPLLFAFAILSVWNLVTDALKLVQAAPEILQIQRLLDPWWMTIFYLIIIGSVIWEMGRKSARGSLSPKPVTSTGNVLDFPDDQIVMKASEVHGIVDSRISELEMMLAAAATSADIIKSDTLELEHLQVLVDPNPLKIEVFLAKHGIEKISKLDGIWSADKNKVFEALGIGK